VKDVKIITTTDKVKTKYRKLRKANDKYDNKLIDTYVFQYNDHS